MKIVSREHIDLIKWDFLVDKTEDASVFSYSWFLDVVAENWCVIVNDDYTQGIALPFTNKMGIKIIYTPVFVMYLEVLGNQTGLSKIKEIILGHFKYIDFSTKQNIFGENSIKWMYQVVPFGFERKIRTQAKRSLNNAEKKEIIIKKTKEYSAILDTIKHELSGKFEGLNDKSLQILSKLVDKAAELNILLAFKIENDGGVICIKNKNRLIYLKGAVTESIKKKGGMYKLINESIIFSGKEGLHFDFGGSRVEGVRKFNHNLGGIDAFYYNFKSNNYPFWYTFFKNLKQRFKK